MASTVTIPDRARGASAASLDDFALPRQKSEGSRAFFIWLGIMATACVLLAAIEATRGVAIGVAIWWLLCVWGFFILGPFLLRRRLFGLGDRARVTSHRQPRLKTLISKASPLLGIGEPVAFVEDDDSGRVRIIGRANPYLLSVSRHAQEEVSEEEMDVLVLRELMHARQNHGARLTMLALLNEIPPIARILVWPIALYGSLLRGGWLDAAQQSADRLSLLLKPDAKLLQAAILKQQVLTNPMMQERKITSSDVDNFLRNKGPMNLEGAEITTQYKLGTAIHENISLEERIVAINAWARSPEFAQAVQKLREGRKSAA